MRLTVAALGFLFMTAVGCLSAPVPQELVDVAPVAPLEPLRIQEIVRLSNAGVSSDLIVELIRSHGIADRPALAEIAALERQGVAAPVVLLLLASTPTPPPKPQPKVVYRDLFIPLWPSFSGGRWHFGLRVACYHRLTEEEAKKLLPPEPLPEFIDP